jgi:biopolymer transport protein ExbD
MKLLRRKKAAYEPPAVLLTDLAFNLVIFFVVCASSDPEANRRAESGRRQDIPSSSKDQAKMAEEAKNIEVHLERDTTHVEINGLRTPLERFTEKLTPLLAGKTRPEERMVVVRSNKDVPYQHWIRMTGMIEKAGGVVALQVEEEKEVIVK